MTACVNTFRVESTGFIFSFKDHWSKAMAEIDRNFDAEDFLHSSLKDISPVFVSFDYLPNRETIKVFEEAERGENIVKCKDLDDLFSKLGI